MKITSVKVGTRDGFFTFPVDYNDYHARLAWRLLYLPDTVTGNELLEAAGIIDFYHDLLRDPGAIEKLRKMRAEVKAQDSAFRAVAAALRRG